MRFLLDQDVYAATARFLKEKGHNIVCAAEIGRSQASDATLLHLAQEQDRVFVTRDRDFGGLVFVRELGVGVVYLRIHPSTLNTIHKELGRVLDSYTEQELKQAFIVVEPGRHRYRRVVRQASS